MVDVVRDFFWRRCGVEQAAMVISGSDSDEQRTKESCDEREARKGIIESD
jgi:hypothetical protein